MNALDDIIGKGIYILMVGTGPLVIKVDVIPTRPGGYLYFVDISNSFPGAMIPELVDLLDAVHERLERLNHR